MEVDHGEVRSFWWLLYSRMFFCCCVSLYSFIIELTATTLDRKFLGKIVPTLKVAFLNYSTSGPRDFVFQHSQRSLSRRTCGKVDKGAEFSCNAFHTRQ